jgi:hypothetical protein
MKHRMIPVLSLLALLPLVFGPGSASAEEAKNAAEPAAASAAAPAGAAELSPEQVVAAYLKAMQEQRFADAFPLVSTTLRAGKSAEEWIKEQQYIMQMGEVKILEFRTYPAIIGADGIARVPNVLKSQDKFLNQLGLDEHEIYELIKEKGLWRIDQQTLAEGADRETYFPAAAGKK